MIGKWETDISAGGCHLNEKDKQAAHVSVCYILCREHGR